MGGADLPLFNGHFLFDTGTTKVLLPKKMASEINKQIKAIPDTSARGGPKADEDPESDEDRVIDCATGPSLPAVNFFFAGIKTPLTLSGKQLYFNQIGEDKKVRCLSIFEGTFATYFRERQCTTDNWCSIPQIVLHQLGLWERSNRICSASAGTSK